MDWTGAACAEVGGDLWFPEGELGTEAKRVCAGCEVRTQCLEYAMDNRIAFGVWGGLSWTERNALRRKRVGVRPPQERRPCGTEAAYRRHLRRGESPCADCREAHMEDGRIRWARKKAAA